MPGYLVKTITSAPASSISVNATSTITSTDVQSALQEIDQELQQVDKEISYAAIAPINPNTGDLWIDITLPLEPFIKVYDGSTWIIAGSAGDSGFDDFFLSF